MLNILLEDEHFQLKLCHVNEETRLGNPRHPSWGFGGERNLTFYVDIDAIQQNENEDEDEPMDS